jgi:signal transduction histidine kinase
LVNPEDEQYNLAPYTQMYEDKTHRLTFAEINKPDFKGFSALRGTSLSAGYTKSAYWLTFRIVALPNRPFDWLLEIGYPNLHRLELYIKRANGSVVFKRGGALEPFARRELTAPSFVFALDDSTRSARLVHAAQNISTLPDTLTCYLRVETESAMIVPLKLYTSRAFERGTIVESLLYGLLYGVMMAMACYNLFLWITVRERFYLYYVFYVVFFLLGDIAIKGFGAVLTQSVQVLWVRSLPHVMPVSSLCAVLFARNFLRPAEYSPIADKVLLGAVVCHTLVLVLTLVVPYSVIVPAIAMMIGVVSIILLVTGIASLRSGYRPARFFVAGWTVFLTASLLRSFSTVGAYSFTWWADHMPIVGAALETLLLSLALADRINLLKRQQAEVLERAVKQRTAELNEANAALEQANRFKTQMLSIAAHDLKNPLSAITGFSEIIASELEPAHEMQSFLGHIQHTADRMGKLIRDLLDSAAMELGNITLTKQTVPLGMLVSAMKERYGLAVEAKRQRFVLDVAHEIEIEADIERLGQVFDNLISNAVKYSPPGATIAIRVSVREGWARVEVQDEGIGLSEEDKSRLFGFFQRLTAMPTDGESSNGVGLAIAKKIVDLHGGKIWCESERDKGIAGAMFVVELPIEVRSER